MNYKESKKILKGIKKANKILINCHKSPDVDSVGSALAVALFLKKSGKKFWLVSPDDIPQNLKFLPLAEKIGKENYRKFKFENYDLFICLDSSSEKQVLGKNELKLPKIPIINIDHHKTNTKYGKINLVDSKQTSTAELLYLVFEDLGIEIDREMATCLLAGIIGDTGAFRFAGVGLNTFRNAIDLMEAGADKDEIIFNIFHSFEINTVKTWGEILLSMKVEEKDGFVWSAIPYAKYEKYGKPKTAKEWAATLFAQAVAGTDFGIMMVEQAEGYLSVSLRSRTGVDVSKIAEELGGGGHIPAAGARIEGLSFEEAVGKVLEVARKHARKAKK